MARQNMRPEPWLKHMESFDNFSGGLNTIAEDTTMAENEVPLIVNTDIGERGSVSRRHGMTHHIRRPIWGDIKGKTWGEL